MMIIKAIGVKIGIGIVAAVVVMPLMATTIQAELESFLRNRCVTRDYFPDGVPEDVPNRHLNSLPEFKKFFSSSGWTTNQFIEGLICAIPNNVKDENWVDEDRKLTAERAVWKLSEIDSPVVTNFFRRFNDSSDNSRLKVVTIPAMAWRTNLEPEVMAYMRSLCVRTNVYCNVEDSVVKDMFVLSYIMKRMKYGRGVALKFIKGKIQLSVRLSGADFQVFINNFQNRFVYNVVSAVVTVGIYNILPEILRTHFF